MAQEGMFWELVPADVIETPAELKSADFGREWRRRKHKMEKTSRRPWTEFEDNPRTVQLRESVCTEGIVRNFCGRQTLLSQRVFQARKSAI